MRVNFVTYQISLDIQSEHAQVSLPVRRWDTGRNLEIGLTSGGQPYVIDDDCTAEFVCRKPNGSVLRNDCRIEDNTIFYTLTKATTSLSGQMDCQIRLLDGAGNLITSPRFLMVVYATIYDYGDAAESEIVSANTVKSANPGYAEVFMWSDGNPDGADRVGYFVGADEDRAASMVRICDGSSDIRGVTMAAPGFAANAAAERFDENSSLLSQFCYVGLLGYAPVIDNGTCAVNGRCRPGDDGTAVPDDSGGGFLVVERLDETHVLILLEQEADMMLKLGDMLERRMGQVRTLFCATIPAEWAGSEPPYTQTVSVPGILESDSPHIAPVYDSDRDTALEQMESWSLVTGAAAGADTLTFTCLEDKPQEKIPIQIEVIR